MGWLEGICDQHQSESRADHRALQGIMVDRKGFSYI
jgi:hypothetical protein